MTPRTTLDDLALAVANGFTHVDKRFDETNAKLDRIERSVRGTCEDPLAGDSEKGLGF